MAGLVDVDQISEQSPVSVVICDLKAKRVPQDARLACHIFLVHLLQSKPNAMPKIPETDKKKSKRGLGTQIRSLIESLWSNAINYEAKTHKTSCHWFIFALLLLCFFLLLCAQVYKRRLIGWMPIKTLRGAFLRNGWNWEINRLISTQTRTLFTSLAAAAPFSLPLSDGTIAISSRLGTSDGEMQQVWGLSEHIFWGFTASTTPINLRFASSLPSAYHSLKIFMKHEFSRMPHGMSLGNAARNATSHNFFRLFAGAKVKFFIDFLFALIFLLCFKQFQRDSCGREAITRFTYYERPKGTWRAPRGDQICCFQDWAADTSSDLSFQFVN